MYSISTHGMAQIGTLISALQVIEEKEAEMYDLTHADRRGIARIRRALLTDLSVMILPPFTQPDSENSNLPF